MLTKPVRLNNAGKRARRKKYPNCAARPRISCCRDNLTTRFTKSHQVHNLEYHTWEEIVFPDSLDARGEFLSSFFIVFAGVSVESQLTIPKDIVVNSAGFFCPSQIVRGRGIEELRFLVDEAYDHLGACNVVDLWTFAGNPHKPHLIGSGFSGSDRSPHRRR